MSTAPNPRTDERTLTPTTDPPTAIDSRPFFIRREAALCMERGFR